MVVVLHGPIESLDVPNEDFSFPLLSRLEWVLVVLQEESELHATGKDLALGAIVTFTALTGSVSKDGKSEDGRADRVEASSCLTGERRQTCRQGFDIFIRRIELC